MSASGSLFQEKKRLIQAVFYPFVFLCVMWLLKAIEWAGDWHFASWGLFPRSFLGLFGVISMPFLHSSWGHLLSNSIPFFLLSSILFYFYKSLSWRVFLSIWLLTGACLWIGGKASYHIGASGWVYGLAAFLFFSGVWRKNRTLMRVTLLVAFLYGGMLWGFFPEFFPKKNISWEGHLFGFLVGMLLAWVYRRQGPPNDNFEWDDSDVPDDEDAYWRSNQPNDYTALSKDAKPKRIYYHIHTSKK